MEVGDGEHTASILLRVLPEAVAEQVLSYMDGGAADRLRGRVNALTEDPPPEQVEQALGQFFTLVDRADVPPPAPPAAPPLPDSSDPVTTLSRLDPSLIARALGEELPSTTAVVLGRLGVEHAADVLKRLDPARRGDVTVRMAAPASVPPALADRLTHAVLDKALSLSSIPPEPTAEERSQSLSEMFRRLGRDERAELLERLQQSDPEMAQRVKGHLYRFEDILKIEDRPLRDLLAEIDHRALATALRNADEAITEKIFQNISTRAKDLIMEEVALLGSVTNAKVEEARSRVVEIIRRFDEAGKIELKA